MSIDFGTDIYEEPLVGKTLLPETMQRELRPLYTERSTSARPRPWRISESLSRPPGGEEPLNGILGYTALRVWARPRWRASSPPRWESTSASPPARPLKSPVIWRPC